MDKLAGDLKQALVELLLSLADDKFILGHRNADWTGLAPILEEVAGWERYRIRSFFEANGVLIQEWERVRTDWLTLRPAVGEPSEAGL